MRRAKKTIRRKRRGGTTRKVPFKEVADMPPKEYITPTRPGAESPDYSPAFKVESPTPAEIEQLRKEDIAHEMQQGFYKRMNGARRRRVTKKK